MSSARHSIQRGGFKSHGGTSGCKSRSLIETEIYHLAAVPHDYRHHPGWWSAHSVPFSRRSHPKLAQMMVKMFVH
jgi:hypothetical protein